MASNSNSNGAEYSFAALCRIARLDAGLSQAELAELMGVKQASVACMEGRDKPVGERTLDKVATALGTTTLGMLIKANRIAQREGGAS